MTEKSAIHRYAFPFSAGLLQVVGQFAVSLAVWLSTSALFLSGERDSVGYGFVFLIGAVAVTGMFINSLLLTSDVIVSADGIGRSIASFQWHFCRWDEVVAAKAWVQVGMQTGRRKYVYSVIHDPSVKLYFKRKGPIIFGEDIDGAIQLISQINVELRKRNIPVAIVADDHLRSSITTSDLPYALGRSKKI